jgi:drug/metabolite transporter superfamily protein YnfA
MSFKWTDAHLKDGNILDSGEFDTGYNSLKAEINGGLDRENIQNDSIAAEHLAPEAFLSYALKEGIRAQEPLERELACYGNHIYGKTYNVYGGGWVTNSAQKLSKRFLEGNLHLEFNAWYYLNNANSQSTSTQKAYGGRWCRFALSVDNVVVCESHELWQNIGTVHLVADIPITTGQHEITVSWQVAGWDERYGTGAIPQMKNEPLFYYDGGSILAINRYR